MPNYCNKAWKSVVEMLEGNIYSGLNNEECERRRRKYGNNKIDLPYGKGPVSFIKNFFNIYQLISILIITFFIYEKKFVYSIIVGVILIINIIVELIYIIKKYKKHNYFNKINNTTTTVLRNNVKEIVQAWELVKGDIVYFTVNTLIPADIRIIEGENIKVDEKNITGENFLKDKITSKIESRVQNVDEMKNMLFKGSVIKEGEGFGIVVQVGKDTQLGKMMSVIKEANNKFTFYKSLKKQINIFMTLLIIFVGIIGGITFNISKNLNGIDLSLFAIGTLPLGLIILIYSFILKDKLNKKGIELYNVSSLDSIEDIQYIFLDKVGSITKQEVIVNNFLTNSKVYTLDNMIPDDNINIKRMLEIIVLCNDAKYNLLEGTSEGNLIQVAYLKMAAEKEIFKKTIESENPKLFQIPMDSDKRVLTSVNTYKKGYRANVTGNVDSVIDRCTYIMVNGVEKELTKEEIQRIKDLDYNYSIEGMITQGLAYRNFSYKPSTDQNVESNLVFVGIITLDNPVNDEMEKEIQEVKNKGIVPILFTDDNRLAAVSIGKKAGIITDVSGAISGIELNSLNEDEFSKVRNRAKVFARVNPEIKNRILGEYIADDFQVAACGEALGDLSILSMSKIGIAKGKPPEIVKSVSDMYINDDYLKGFLSLFSISRKFKAGVFKEKLFLLFLLIWEIAIIFINPLLNGRQDINFIPLLLINIIIVTPLSLLLIDSGNTKEKYKKSIIRCCIWTAFTLFSINDLKDHTDIILLLIMGGMILIYSAITSKLSFRKITLNLLLFLSTIVLLIISITVLSIINGVNIDIGIILKSGGLLIIYGIIELIMMNWE